MTDRRLKLNRRETDFRLTMIVPSLVFTVAMIVVWQLVVVAFVLPPILLPSPWDVLRAGISESGTIARGTWVTGLAAMSGFFASVVLGTLIAAMMSQSKVLRFASG